MGIQGLNFPSSILSDGAIELAACHSLSHVHSIATVEGF